MLKTFKKSASCFMLSHIVMQTAVVCLTEEQKPCRYLYGGVAHGLVGGW